MEDIDIKNFTRVSSVTDEDSVLLSRGVSSATHGQIAFGLFRSSVSKDISPSIVNGIWHIGSTNTGIEAKGADGKTPVFSTGTVATGLPDTNVIVQVRYDGINENGNPSYVIDFTIPAGKPGQDGDGAGNVYVTTDGLESGKTYLFQPGADGSANGTMVEFTGKEIEGGVGKEYPGYPGAEIFNDYENNIAAGKNAHAEGQETNATGPRAHAEGYKTTVYAADSHAEGRSTWAIGPQTHVEGMYSMSWGAVSHVEGSAESGGGSSESSHNRTVLASYDISDIEFILQFTNNSEYFSLNSAEKGNEHLAVNMEGILSKYCVHASFGERNHVEGFNNVCFSNNCHVEGFENICGHYITVHGTARTDNAIHIEGHNNDVITEDYWTSVIATHVEGGYNTVAPTEEALDKHYTYINSEENDSPSIGIGINRVQYSHVGGAHCTLIKASCAFAHGEGLFVNNDYEAAFGRYNLSEQDGKKVLFAYGIGTSDINRLNAFSILEDGTVLIPKMAGGNAEDIVTNKLIPLQNQLTNMYNEFTAIINKQQAQIDSLINLITQLHPGLKVFVVGDRLVITSLMDADVSGGQLNISDTDTKVVDDVLVFGDYVPVPEPPSGDSKAYVYLNTLYFTDLINVSVDGGTLSISDTETTVTNGVLTIK